MKLIVCLLLGAAVGVLFRIAASLASIEEEIERLTSPPVSGRDFIPPHP